MRKRVAHVVVPAERDLAAVWARTTGMLTLAGGGAVRVVYPGRKNPEAGPDFVDAVLETEAGEVRGSVELHRLTSDWQRHGHGADPRYGGVVLHVVGRHDGAASRRPGGEQLPLLELAAAPDGEAGSGLRFPCATASAGGHDLLPALLTAGEARFRANAARMRHELESAAGEAAREQVAYEALAETLGYSRNAATMRELARAVPLVALAPRRCVGERELLSEEGRSPHPLATLGAGSSPLPEGEGIAAGVPEGEGMNGASSSRVLRAEALVLGTAGLLPSQRHLRRERRRDAYVETLERLWVEQQAADRRPALRAYAWDMGRVRPENAPVRRVVALAHLARRWPAAGLLPAVRAAGRSAPPAVNRSLAALIALPAPPGYWAQHWDFGVPVRSPQSAVRSPMAGGDSGPRARDLGLRSGGAGGGGDAVVLIGPSRAADAVVNVLLPLAAALGELSDDGALVRGAEAAYAAHPPLAENWITRLVRERTGLCAAGARLPEMGSRAEQPAIDPIKTAQTQQGLIAIYEGPCRDLRCADCALGAPAALRARILGGLAEMARSG